MLFKKKDSNESIKAKTSLFASKAKKDDALEKESERELAAPHGTDDKGSKKLKTTIATGKADAGILIRPRITEKAANASVNNVYTFDVNPASNKRQIIEAVKDVYGVTPLVVRIVTVPTKAVYNRKGTTGVSGGGKKAYVQLKKGDKIELV